MGAFGSNPSQGKDPALDLPSHAETPLTADRKYILIVEDNTADAFLMREAMEQAQVSAELYLVNDGDKAVRLIDIADRDDDAPCPALVVLDLNLPKKHGVEVLKHLRQSRRCPDARVVIATSSDSANDREDVAKLGADIYFRKPSRYEDFMKLGEIAKSLLNSGAPPR